MDTFVLMETDGYITRGLMDSDDIAELESYAREKVMPCQPGKSFWIENPKTGETHKLEREFGY